METVAVIIFLGVFAVVALLLIAGSSGAAHQSKQVLATLDSAIAVGGQRVAREQMLDLRKQETLSAIPMINRWLQQIEVAPRLHRLLTQAALKWTAGGLLSGMAAAFAAVGYIVYLRTGTPILGLALGGAAGFAPLGFVLQKRGKRFLKFETQLPEALDLMVSALRVGHSLNAALGLVSRECQEPLGNEFRICYDEQNYGLELRSAMDNLVTRMPLQDLRIVVTAILIQKESGGNLAEVLDKVGHVIRERFRLKRQVMTHTAQGRLTGWILSAMPVVLGIALYLINPTTMSLLWTREVGVKLLYLSGAMTTVGTLIINKIVNMEV